ncbi:MAG: hypothetical protein K2P90_01790, partial [Holosporales bacterium]|nr:hypothetical protein [Holosporales bacterium]
MIRRAGNSDAYQTVDQEDQKNFSINSMNDQNQSVDGESSRGNLQDPNRSRESVIRGFFPSYTEEQRNFPINSMNDQNQSVDGESSRGNLQDPNR